MDLLASGTTLASAIRASSICPSFRILLVATLTLCSTCIVHAQFSPGELSRAHQSLDGPNNCTQCHEVGKSISGQKCLACHEEIQQLITGNHGYHFRIAGQQCIDCHKEHVGREAATYKFASKTFNHDQTGYTLAGKHRELDCTKCHSREQIRDKDVLKVVTDYPHTTYLGLRPACYSCHTNPHEEILGEKCAGCHTETSWKKIRAFDHSSTRYPLLGKHRTVACVKCHTNSQPDSSRLLKSFLVTEYAECNSCHKSPHTEKMTKQSCKSCHTEEGWNVAMKKRFNHDLTGFRLAGKHATIACEKCHRPVAGASFSSTFLVRHRGCIDCHKDYHLGEFAKTHDNNCSDCHTLATFSPSTYTLEMHNKTHFQLTGGHLALPCQNCHQKKAQKPAPFHFANLRCESCHMTVHDMQFDTPQYAAGCQGCHRTESWQEVSFDHGTTKFALKGKHSIAACRECHKPVIEGQRRRFPFKGLRQACETCHTDSHNKQFESNGETTCEWCHTTELWKNLVFDHQRDSKFKISGAHVKVPCNQCHKQESIGGLMAVRYKPLSVECESCHTKGNGT